jgi:hypothetical protein
MAVNASASSARATASSSIPFLCFFLRALFCVCVCVYSVYSQPSGMPPLPPAASSTTIGGTRATQSRMAALKAGACVRKADT